MVELLEVVRIVLTGEDKATAIIKKAEQSIKQYQMAINILNSEVRVLSDLQAKLAVSSG